jgi:hypothetical protein
VGDVSFARAERTSWRLPVAREPLLCAAVATVTAALLAWLAPLGVDLAAHEYQRSLFLAHGLTLWDNYWYAGRYAFIGYSVLYYPLAALLGIKLLGVLTVGLAAAAFARLVEREWGDDGIWPGRSFALVWPGVVLGAEFPFALGITLALLGLLALQSGRRWTAAALSVLVLAASPLAFVLLVVVLAGIAAARPHALRWAAVPILAVALATAAELLVLRLFPTGRLGFLWVELVEGVAFCLGLLALTWRLERARILRGVLAAYLLVVVAAYAIPSGLGHGIVRLRLFALPVALLVVALRRWRPLPVAFAAVALAGTWNILPLAGIWIHSSADRSSSAAMWTAPVDYLRTHLHTGYRVEGVDTSQHWPAFYLARAEIPLVRGWFRQDDHPVSTLLYRRFTAAEYLAWLRRLGVEYVVLTNAPPDYSSRREGALIRSGMTGLKRVFATRDVSIYAVPRPQPIVTGPGRPALLRMEESRLLLRLSRAGSYRIAVRWSPYWHASTGCLARTPDGMTRLRTTAGATVRIAFGVDAHSLLRALVHDTSTCG